MSACWAVWLSSFKGTTPLGTVFLDWPANPFWDTFSIIFPAPIFSRKSSQKVSTWDPRNGLKSHKSAKNTQSKRTRNQELQKDKIWKGSNLIWWQLHTFSCFFKGPGLPKGNQNGVKMEPQGTQNHKKQRSERSRKHWKHKTGKSVLLAPFWTQNRGSYSRRKSPKNQNNHKNPQNGPWASKMGARTSKITKNQDSHLPKSRKSHCKTAHTRHGGGYARSALDRYIDTKINRYRDT